jgi:DNA-binding IclR family transcriptional regulator
MGTAVAKAVKSLKEDDSNMAAEISQTSEIVQLGIQSTEMGMRLMGALVEHAFDNPAPMLKTLAAKAGMPPEKAHRYMVSLVRSELVERDTATGRYRLGPMARLIGLRAIQSLDVIKISHTHLPTYCVELGFSVCLAIWSYNGPTIVAVEEALRPITIGTRVGYVMPIISSATGQVFGAYLPRPMTQNLVKQEVRALKDRGDFPISKLDIDKLFDAVRKSGVGATEGGLNRTTNAVSAPIFDHRGVLVAAISTLGPADELDPARDGPIAKRIKAIAAGLSRELGYIAEVAAESLPL